jgi:hypothetical protein
VLTVRKNHFLWKQHSKTATTLLSHANTLFFVHLATKNTPKKLATHQKMGSQSSNADARAAAKRIQSLGAKGKCQLKQSGRGQ